MPAITVIEDDAVSNMSKPSRMSGTKNKMSEWQIRNMRDENKRLKN